MAKVHHFRLEDERQDQASLWIERLSEDLSSEELTELKIWLAEDGANRLLLEKMARLWDKMDSLSRLSVLVPQHVSEPQQRHVKLFPKAAALAAVVLGLSMVLFSNFWRDSNNSSQIVHRPAEIIYETEVGEHKTYTLEDGSKITLNTNSRVGVRFTRYQRLLHLESGEVHVEVSKDPDRPLNAMAGDHVIQAIGTAFNLEIKPDRKIELLVTEGSVRIGEKQDLTRVGLKDADVVMPLAARVVVAGHELIISDDSEVAHSISGVDIQAKLSWRDGNLIFRGESLAVAAQEVERYTGVKIVFVNEDLKEARVSGFFRAGDVDGMLSALKENFNIDYQRETETRVLLYRI